MNSNDIESFTHDAIKSPTDCPRNKENGSNNWWKDTKDKKKNLVKLKPILLPLHIRIERRAIKW